MKSYAVGIDLGGTNIKAGLVDSIGKIVLKKSIETCAEQGYKRVIERMAGLVLELVRTMGEEVKGVGIGTPGLVDAERGVVIELPNLKGWTNVPVCGEIRKLTGYRCFLGNDANNMAFGESTVGAAKGKRNIVCITLGTGVGGGIIIDGKVYQGSTGVAGEVGHTIIDMNGPECNCGGRGCLERYVGNKYISEYAVKVVKKFRGKSKIVDAAGGDVNRITPEAVYRAAKAGDMTAKKILRDIGRLIGIGLVSVVNILNPEMVVIGGGVANAGELLFRGVRDGLMERGMKGIVKSVRVVKAKLGNDAGIIGSAMLAMRG